VIKSSYIIITLHSGLRVIPKKLEDSMTKIVKLALYIEETKKLIELLEKSTIRNNDKVRD
jgi:hypothetical protein